MRFEYGANEVAPFSSFFRVLQLLQRSATARQQTEGFVVVEKRL
jgi:hypothetical protein